MPYRHTLRLAAFLSFTLAVTPSGVAQGSIFSGLVGEELRLALTSYTPTQVLSEAASKDTLYAVVDRVSVDGQDGTVGLYTGLFVPFDCDPSCDPSQDVFNGGAGINQEHVWPRSLGAGSGTAERDLHHLFPSRVAVNEARGNLPFGESPDEETTAWYYLGETQSTPPAEDRDAWSELLGGVRFEPREEKKGDVARALFYFYAVYGPVGTGQADEAFFEAMKETLLAWHEGDPPTAEEVARSERVAQYQATGSGEPAINPFVHDTTLVRRAYFPETVIGPVVFVNAGATGSETGMSWADAFTTIQDAFAYAKLYGDLIREVWVAEGTYRPTNDDPNSDDPREATFRLRSGLSLYGGFGGTETSIEERDWEAHPTVLSGDIGVEGDPSDNAYSVVRAHLANSTTVLDGFVVTGGNASVAENQGFGGGLYVTSSDITLRNLRVTGNSAALSGGGGYVSGSAPQMSALTFEDNTAGRLGGGLYVYPGLYGEGNVVLTDATFIGNTAHDGGGLYWNGESDEIGGVIERVAFEGNAADPESGRGGGMNTGSSPGSLIVSDVTFDGNSAHVGGGYGGYGSGSLVLSQTTFVGNVASYGGGFATGGHFGMPILRDARFEDNVALAAGGGLFCGQVPGSDWSGGANVVGAEFVRNAAPEGGGLACAGSFVESNVYNASFLGNTAERGGAVALRGGPGLKLVNVVVAGNAAGEGGTLYSSGSRISLAQVTAVGNEGGAFLRNGGNATVENSVVWGNGTSIDHEGYMSIWVWDNIIEGGCPPPPGDIHCSGVQSTDPLVTRAPAPGPDGEWGTEDDDYGEVRLQPGSPAVNAGSVSRLPLDFLDLDGDGDVTEPIPYDLAGDARVQGGNPDLGALEGGYLVSAEHSAVATHDGLAAPYPNPARGTTAITLTLGDGRAGVRVEVVDVLGRRVGVLHDGPLAAGVHRFALEGERLPAGVYVVRASGVGLDLARRLTLVR